MPIIPRFEQNFDPNAVPETGLAESFQRGMLAGSNIKRNATLNAATEQNMELASAEHEMRKADRADAKSLAADNAAIEGFFLGQQGDGVNVPSASSVDGVPSAGGDPEAPFQAAEIEGAREFIGSLKSDEARAQFAKRYGSYLKDRLVTKEARVVAGKLQDSLMRIMESPEAAPFVERAQANLARLDMLDDPNLTPEQRIELTKLATSENTALEELLKKEVDKNRRRAAYIQSAQALAAQYPPTSPLGKQLSAKSVQVEFSDDPEGAYQSMVGLTIGMVEDPDKPGTLISQKTLEERDLERYKANLEVETSRRIGQTLAARTAAAVARYESQWREEVSEDEMGVKTTRRIQTVENPLSLSQIMEEVNAAEGPQSAPGSRGVSDAGIDAQIDAKLGGAPAARASGSTQRNPHLTIKPPPPQGAAAPEAPAAQPKAQPKAPPEEPTRIGKATNRIAAAAATELARSPEAQLVTRMASKAADVTIKQPLERIAKLLALPFNAGVLAGETLKKLPDFTAEQLERLADALEGRGEGDVTPEVQGPPPAPRRNR